MSLAGSISPSSIQYVDYFKIFNDSLDLSTIYLFALVGVEFSLCAVVTPSWNVIVCLFSRVACFVLLLDNAKIVFLLSDLNDFYFSKMKLFGCKYSISKCGKSRPA